MATFKDLNKLQSETSTNGISKQSNIKVMAAEVKAKVSIPMYFYNIVIPQLGSYFDTYPVNFDNDPRACCPLHDEDTPSFRYYEETNSFYCFGCQKGGDVINLHMYFAEKINGKKPERDEAIAFLYQYFIKGKESSEFIDRTAQKIGGDEKLNSDAEIVKFNIYRVNLENSITFDKSIKLEAKEQLWNDLDKIDMLLSKNFITADSAEKYIKQRVSEIITLENTAKQHKLISFK